MMDKPILRLCEWGSVSTKDDLTSEQREEIAQAVSVWQSVHRLPQAPLSFSGPSGERLSARQYVGVVEAGGVTVEIYPKLDAALLAENALPKGAAKGVLENLLWLLEVVQDDQPRETDTAGLADTETPFLEMFALLFARSLRRELSVGGGPVRRYEAMSGDLPAVRGRIALSHQVTRHWNRMDTIACTWDEFTPNHLLNQVLRCACRWLRDRVGGTETRWLLTDCWELLDDVVDVSIPAALKAARQLSHFDRTAQRFRLSFDLAVRLLSGTGPILQAGGAETFVFLVDMNDLFERYVHAVLQAAFRVPIRQQAPVWYLFPNLTEGRLAQKPDFSLTDRNGIVWIGDAKYKHLARGQESALRFVTAPVGESGSTETTAGRLLSSDDVRQLTVYAELEHRARSLSGTPGTSETSCARLLLLYPFVGSGTADADRTIAWNGSPFYLAPVRVTPTRDLGSNFPFIPNLAP
jgi:5-methylcytosine-specific restriction enzyme subunit McrC